MASLKKIMVTLVLLLRKLETSTEQTYNYTREATLFTSSQAERSSVTSGRFDLFVVAFEKIIFDWWQYRASVGKIKKKKMITWGKWVVPPIGAAEVRFEVISGASCNDHWRGHQSTNHQKHAEYTHDHPQPLQKVHIRDSYGLCGPHVEYHRNSRQGIQWIQRIHEKSK